MNIFSNFILSKVAKFNDQDLPWFGEITNAKNRLHEEHFTNGRSEGLYYLLQNLTSEISSYSSKSKNDCPTRLGRKLDDRSTSIKSYWATLKPLRNGKKVPNMPPLLVSNELIIKFDPKVNIFNKYFASQSTAIIIATFFLRLLIN